MNLPIIQWDVDTKDWTGKSAAAVLSVVRNETKDGSIILMHNGAKYTAQALDTVITKLQEQGYELVPVSSLVYRENYHMDHEGRQIPD